MGQKSALRPGVKLETALEEKLPKVAASPTSGNRCSLTW